MKKLIFIFILILIVLIISYTDRERSIKINTIYKHNLEVSNENNTIINIDDTKVVNKAKEIVKSIFVEEDLNVLNIESGFLGSNEFYVYFIYNETPKYYLLFDIDEGVLIKFYKEMYSYNEYEKNYKSAEELLENSQKYIEILNERQYQDYEIYSYNYYDAYNLFSIVYVNKYNESQINLMLDYTTGEFFQYDNYSQTEFYD